MDINLFVQQNWWLIILVFAWSIFWKGWTLWRAAKLDQKVWFIVFLIVNTLGILEIFYLFYFSKQRQVTNKSSR